MKSPMVSHVVRFHILWPFDRKEAGRAHSVSEFAVLVYRSVVPKRVDSSATHLY